MEDLNKCLSNATMNSSTADDSKNISNKLESSTPIFTKSIKTKNDSAYSSFVSPKACAIMNSNTSLIKEGNLSYESPGTSYSSRNSALANDDEMEDLFRGLDSIEIEKEKIGISFFISDNFFRRSTHNSPWTVRPDSAPLNEEEEDSDKEASNYLYKYQGAGSNDKVLPEIVQSTLLRSTRVRHISMTDADERNEIIASKLKQIADNLPSLQKKKIRHKSCVFSSETLRSSSNKRHSFSSFTDMMPNGMGSALDLLVSFYKIYKQSNQSPSDVIINSQSTQNMVNYRQRSNKRNRSYTD